MAHDNTKAKKQNEAGKSAHKKQDQTYTQGQEKKSAHAENKHSKSESSQGHKNSSCNC